MSSPESSRKPIPEKVRTLILTIHEDMGGSFVQTVCPDASGSIGEATIEGQQFTLSVLAEDPRTSTSWAQRVGNADALVLQVRFMDALSMDRLKAICSHLPSDPPKPMGVFLLREEGENDFKMSCPSCGQKLWVHDTDVGKRGRCPNCKKAFRLPEQTGHTVMELGLTDTTPVTTVTRGDPASCRNALSALKKHLTTGGTPSKAAIDPEILMKSTERIDVQETEDDA